MKRLSGLSFRNKLLLAFLLIGVVPLLIFTVLMLNIFRVTLAGNARDAAEAELSGAARAIDTLLAGGAQVLDALSDDELVRAELSDPGAEPPQSVYDALYTLSSELRGQADFALYSAEGELLFTTGTGSAGSLGTHWGLLNAAAASGDTAYAGSEGNMLAARAVTEGAGPVGYAVMSLSPAQLEELFSAYVGMGGILLLDPYWDCVYRSANAGDEALAPKLREQLLNGEPLSDGTGGSFYVSESAETGFFLLYRQPEPVADWVMRLLYLVAALTIVICVALCALVSMMLSRQLFEPVRELNAAMGRIVAAPTAGSCGILPAALLTMEQEKGCDRHACVMALFTASAVGLVIARNACLAGAQGGCQAECGSASAMAAAVIMGVDALPERRVAAIPYRLRIRPAQQDAAPAFQLFPFAGIQAFIIFPLICDSLHSCSPY